MPSFSGQFQYVDSNGAALGSAPCRVTFEADSFTLAPSSGPPIAFDLGDIDVFAPGEYELTLTLYTGKKVVLSRFAKAFDNLRHELLEAYRLRLLQCLLLEDLEEVARFDGFARLELSVDTDGWTSPAEFRLFKSNLAVLPIGATGFQWRLADIESVSFDRNQYATILESDAGRLTVAKLAKRTEDFKEKLEDAINILNENSAQALHRLFPFLSPDQFRSVASLMREGRAVSLRKLKAIHPRIELALAANAIDASLRPYFAGLAARSLADEIYTGFKLLRESETEAGGADSPVKAEDEVPGAGALNGLPDALAHEASNAEERDREPSATPPILHWYFFPIASRDRSWTDVLAWEASTKSGRATYFFRWTSLASEPALRDRAAGSAAIAQAVHELNHALVTLNFRREPIYLPNDRLEFEPRFRRHAIACRKLSELRRLRAAFLGRAIHASPEAWSKQVDELLQSSVHRPQQN